MINIEQATYSELSNELENIMVQIEDKNIDVDILIEKIKEAALLLKACKQKLKGSEQQINEIINEIGKKDD